MKTLFTLCFLLCCTLVFAQAEREVEAKVEALRLALIDPTEANLKALSSENLSYGHSSGKLENQSQFIEALVSGVSDFASITFKDQTIQMEKDIAIVRHKLAADITDGGVSNSIEIGVMLVWHKEKGQWKLLARQAYKLP
ncbi:nuclear transport factor 2 family protein [Algoriphagus pacificus]|uniref:Nuclear transport factor 2 family protein n=1 Tax=Algoriphagus pacificus TaxID=2811234 RepID=A0ABS3CEE0_9BACT|nr:nuclear transport factor 2 family protein [Algoriphagus pacificus]MBN7815473.1 nuclear transport factor 2 family protein [Algoriphagus pacificus]